MVLIKYGKSIVNEQYILNRLANSAMDIFASACVTSRASGSLNLGLPTANHEKLMAETFVFEVSNLTILNVIHNLYIYYRPQIALPKT